MGHRHCFVGRKTKSGSSTRRIINICYLQQEKFTRRRFPLWRGKGNPIRARDINSDLLAYMYLQRPSARLTAIGLLTNAFLWRPRIGTSRLNYLSLQQVETKMNFPPLYLFSTNATCGELATYMGLLPWLTIKAQLFEEESSLGWPGLCALCTETTLSESPDSYMEIKR